MRKRKETGPWFSRRAEKETGYEEGKKEEIKKVILFFLLSFPVWDCCCEENFIWKEREKENKALRLFGFLIPKFFFPLGVPLGGLFDGGDTVQEFAFRYAMDRVNKDKEVLPDCRLTAQIVKFPKMDSFYAAKEGKEEWHQVPFKMALVLRQFHDS